MLWQRWAIHPDDPERFVADIFDAVLFAEGRIECGFGTDFPLPLALNHDLGAPADEEQHLFRFFVHVIGNHTTDLGNVHSLRNILDPTKLGGEQEFRRAGRNAILPLNICGFHKRQFVHYAVLSTKSYQIDRELLFGGKLQCQSDVPRDGIGRGFDLLPQFFHALTRKSKCGTNNCHCCNRTSIGIENRSRNGVDAVFEFLLRDGKPARARVAQIVVQGRD